MKIRTIASRDLQVAIIADEKGIEALKEDWNNLYMRAERPYLSQSFEWAWCAWQTIAKPSGQRPCFVVIRSGNRIMLIWPMMVSTRNLFWAVAEPLGTTEYTDILVEGGPRKRDLAILAWQALQKSSGAALIRVDRVRRDSLLADVLVTQPARRVHSGVVRYVVWDGCESWESYWRPTEFRRQVDRKLRRLREQGNVSFEVVVEQARQGEIATWILQQKKDWISRRNLSSRWVGTHEYEDFFTSLSSRIQTFGHIAVFTLLLDSKVIAAELNQITDSKLELMNLTYDPRYARYSAGHILMKFVLKWAYERNLSYDLRLGGEKYKDHFANRNSVISDYIFINSGWGSVHEYCREIWNLRKFGEKVLVEAVGYGRRQRHTAG
jgi:CelD/BcsL family acetyltransferase involved in cellulose biosynthesis